ncbi:uncharacterized protein GGS22DRAFT_155103 [Annulohypoxylon maeteangense]|uniref:uncharacterized protein n=1 Tax=Annulohypoxylon maeteangense TaxID=1927788 RepID=UPI0020089410|nr:uncharacterized protein GGS22DRAFT_155103 [Annulohypoxylon maeteangense]KAI0888112.1 hypothetical protein GGS22DRAFT_155103 [Annulohypoxylon maeteangense]
MAICESKSEMRRQCECHSTVNMATPSQGLVKGVELSDLMVSNPQDTLWPFDSESNVVLIVAKANEIRNCIFCRETLTERLGMPRFWWSDTYKRMNGYFGSESTRNSGGIIDTCSTWSRALVKHFTTSPISGSKPDIQYRWLKFNLFTRWVMPNKMAILAFDPVDIIEEWLSSQFIKHLHQDELQDPYWPYIRVLEELVTLHGTSVWSLRNLIRTTELSPSRDHRNARNKPKHNYSRLHDIARHAIHVSETLDLSVKLSENILQEHKQLATPDSDVDRRFSTEGAQMFKRAYCNTRSRIAFFRNALSSLRCRSSSNHQRLNNEIQLRFHTDSQYDSQASVEINWSTKSDSASMRWIAIVSLVFLPANLVSSIFSTTFFSGSDGALSVSSDFWIYWVVLVVVTVVTMIFWFYLPRLSPVVDIRRDNSTEKDAESSFRTSFRGLNGVDTDLTSHV